MFMRLFVLHVWIGVGKMGGLLDVESIPDTVFIVWKSSFWRQTEGNLERIGHCSWTWKNSALYRPLHLAQT